MRSFRRLLPRCMMAALAAMCISPLAAPAQAPPPEIAALASRAAAKLAGAGHILAVPMAGCILDPSACLQADAALRAASASRADTPRFVQRNALDESLARRHFIAIDAYHPAVLQAVGPDAGADALVTEDVVWKGAHYELRLAVFRLPGGASKKPYTFAARLSGAPPAPSGQPILLKDPDADAAFILWNGDKHKAPLLQYPRCNACPEPFYPLQARIQRREGAVILRATITERGAVEDVAVVKTFDDDATVNALQAARLWDFAPAVAADGKPFRARITLQVTFRLH